jgi:hypothetical protein
MWKSEKQWSDDAPKEFKPASDNTRERILDRRGAIVLFQSGNEYGIRNMESGESYCPASPHIQVMQEEFDHAWRRTRAGSSARSFQ